MTADPDPCPVAVEHLVGWLARFGPSLGLTIGSKGLPACWADHPVARHEVTGLFLAWSALENALDPGAEPQDPYAAIALPGPRDWLDLSNASAPAVARAIAAGATCARAGHHVAERSA